MAKLITVGVLALQGGVVEHLSLLEKAAAQINLSPQQGKPLTFSFIEVRTIDQLAKCDALIIPGGESTTMAIVARRLGLMDSLRDFVKVQHKPVWGTCAGLVLLSEQASATKQGGQELLGGLDVRVQRNRYGTQVQSFVAPLKLDFLREKSSTEDEVPPFRGVFIRAPAVEEVLVKEKLGAKQPVEVLGVYRRNDADGQGDIVAVKQGHVFGTSFHPELTDDARIHVWWLRQVVDTVRHGDIVVGN